MSKNLNSLRLKMERILVPEGRWTPAMSKIAMFAALVASIPAIATAQSFTTIDDKNGVSDWNAIEECAKRPHAALPRLMVGRDYQMEEQRFHMTDACRDLLIGFMDGWKAAGRGAEENPHPPQPLMQPEDFKYPLKCDWSKLDSNGNGPVDCDLDREHPAR